MRFDEMLGGLNRSWQRPWPRNKAKAPPPGLTEGTSVEEIGLRIAFKAETSARREAKWPLGTKEVRFASFEF